MRDFKYWRVNIDEIYKALIQGGYTKEEIATVNLESLRACDSQQSFNIELLELRLQMEFIATIARYELTNNVNTQDPSWFMEFEELK